MNVFTITTATAEHLWSTNAGVFTDFGKAVEEAEMLLQQSFISDTEKKAAARYTEPNTFHKITFCGGKSCIKVEKRELI